MKEKITSLARSFKDDLVKFLRDIIAIPSLSGNEEEVIKRIQQEMQKLGYDKVWVDPLGNLLGYLGSGKRIIALDGHCDTVDIGNIDTWEIDPFKGDYKDGIIYGRGAADQKGGLASAIYAGKIIKEVGIPDDVSLLVVASVLEENFEGLCWEYIIKEDKISPEAIILTEPTNLGIRIGQRGRMEIKIQTHGISCHGSAPERGENAIYKMAPIIKEIEKYNNRLESKPVLGKGSITITDIRSIAPCLCAVSDRATIHLDRRLTVGETFETATEEIQNLPSVKDAGAKLFVPEYDIKSYTGLVYPVKAYYPIWMMEKEHPLVQHAVMVYKSHFNEEPDIGVWAFSTNGVITKGVFDIPTIGFAAGREEYAHTPKDQVREEDLVKSMEFYTSFLLSL